MSSNLARLWCAPNTSVCGNGALEVTDWFADRLAAELAGGPPPDLLLPMPLHPARLAERGFNQAAEIARRLARLANAPFLKVEEWEDWRMPRGEAGNRCCLRRWYKRFWIQ